MILDKNSKGTSAVFDFFFIKPIPTIIWIVLLIFLGITGYNSLIKESLPDLEIPEFYVLTTWEGATPAMMEKEVTQKIEKELRGMEGLKKMYSSSMYERSIVAVTFQADCRLSESMQLMQRQVSVAQGALPKSAKRSKIESSSVNDIPIATIALSGNVKRQVLDDMVVDLKRKMERIPGLKRAVAVGSREEIVHVQLLPQRLKAYGIPATLVRERIINHGTDAPWGKFENPDLNFSMKMAGAYDDLSELRRLVIAKLPQGRVVRLHELASVRKNHLREKTRTALSWKGGEYIPVVALNLLKAPGCDTIALVEEAERVMNSACKFPSWPEGVEWRLTGNQAEAIQTELARGFTNGWQAMLAVFVVLFVLLTWRESLVAAFSVPLTLSGSMAVLWLMGYTFNLLVIVGMILALGLLVDDFILIMEGMHEGIFIKRLGFVQTVRRTIRTYALPSFSGSITTILVFLPLAFIGGVDGKFIRVIPVTTAVCLVVSYIVSVLLGPSMSRLFLARKNREYGPGMVDRISHKVEARLSTWLGANVVPNKKRALLWTAGAAGLLLLGLLAATELRDTLYPKEDGRTLGITIELATDTTLDESEEVARKLGDILRQKPYFQHVMRTTGGKDAYSMSSFHDYMGRTAAPNIIGFGCFLIPGKDREKLAFEYAKPIRAELEAALDNLPGVRILMNPAIGGSSSEDAVQIDITGNDMSRLREIAQQIAIRLEAVPGVIDVRDNIGPAQTELRFRPMHEAMNHHQVTQNELAGQMIAYMENEKIAKFRRCGTRDDLDVRLGTRWPSQDGEPAGPKRWEELARLSVINSKGMSVPLWSLAEPQMVASENVILHKEGRRSVTVMSKLDGAYTSEVLERMRPQLEKIKKKWPVDYDYVFAGEEDVNNTYRNMFTAFCVAIIFVYAILALLFDSLLYPGIILSTVLFALVGVFFGFMLAEIPFSFSAAIGIVALVGIVVNDAIIMIETMRNHKKGGLDTFAAASLGAADRLRPIVSTTVTNFAGLMPLALSNPGWAPLCQAIIFGELTATVGAVVLIPALFALLTPKS